MGEPLRHHYLPKFYLSRWLNSQRKVIEFRQRFGKLKARPTSPKGTGYRPKLYSKSGGPDPHAIEKGFMSTLDTRASKVLEKLECGLFPEQLTATERSDWSRFIMSLWMRLPSDIEMMKRCYVQEFSTPSKAEEAKYQERRQPGWPSTFAEALAERPQEQVHDDALDVAISLMNHAGLGTIIINMIWYVLDLTSADKTLLTSDRPVMIDLPLTQRDSYISLPLGPKHLFFAGHNLETLERALRMSVNDRVDANNLLVVQHAEETVYACDTSQHAFIEQHIGTSRQPSLFELLSRINRARRDAATG